MGHMHTSTGAVYVKHGVSSVSREPNNRVPQKPKKEQLSVLDVFTELQKMGLIVSDDLLERSKINHESLGVEPHNLSNLVVQVLDHLGRRYYEFWEKGACGYQLVMRHLEQCSNRCPDSIYADRQGYPYGLKNGATHYGQWAEFFSETSDFPRISEEEMQFAYNCSVEMAARFPDRQFLLCVCL